MPEENLLSLNLGALSAAERFEIIHDEIRRRICFLIYPPGSPLSETALASEFGVSRTPIRSVLAQLEAEGLIETHHGAATRVTYIEIQTLRDEYELRMNLAELAGSMGLLPATQNHISDLEDICEELTKFRKNPTSLGYAQINLRFHNVILGRVRNPSLRTLIDRMYFRTSRLWVEKIPHVDWDNEITNFINQVRLMAEMFKTNDDRGSGILQRHIIYTSLLRFVDYGDEEEVAPLKSSYRGSQA